MSLVDASVLIDHLRGHGPAVDLLGGLIERRETVATSEVVRFEVLAGMRPHEEEATEGLFSALDVLAITEPIARRAAALARELRAGHSGIGTADYLLAATSQLYSLPLLTRNVRHFPMISGLEPPY